MGYETTMTEINELEEVIFLAEIMLEDFETYPFMPS